MSNYKLTKNNITTDIYNIIGTNSGQSKSLITIGNSYYSFPGPQNSELSGYVKPAPFGYSINGVDLQSSYTASYFEAFEAVGNRPIPIPSGCNQITGILIGGGGGGGGAGGGSQNPRPATNKSGGAGGSGASGSICCFSYNIINNEAITYSVGSGGAGGAGTEGVNNGSNTIFTYASRGDTGNRTYVFNANSQIIASTGLSNGGGGGQRGTRDNAQAGGAGGYSNSPVISNAMSITDGNLRNVAGTTGIAGNMGGAGNNNSWYNQTGGPVVPYPPIGLPSLYANIPATYGGIPIGTGGGGGYCPSVSNATGNAGTNGNPGYIRIYYIYG